MRYWIDGYWMVGWWREEFFLDPEAEPTAPAPIPGRTSPVVPVPVPIPILDTDQVPTMVDPVAYRLADPVIESRPTSRLHAAQPSRIGTRESEPSVLAKGLRNPTRPLTTIRKQP